MKLNEKGFAISTILYGLLLVGVLVMALLMNTASFNLMTTKDFVDTTEKELNAVADSYYGNGDYCAFITSEPCTAKKTGYYRVNICSGNCTTGIIFLVVGQKLYYTGSEVQLTNGDPTSAIMRAGGTPYISGSVGSVSPKDNSGKNVTYHHSDKYFINGMVTGSSSGNNMTYMGNIDKKEENRNPAFDNIRYVEACGSALWTEIQVIAGGKNIAYGKPVAPVLGSILDPSLGFITDNNLGATGASTGTDCVIVDIGRDMNSDDFYRVDQIGVFGGGVQNTINLYTEDKEQRTVTSTNSMRVNSGYYFNAYSDSWPNY